MKKSLLIFSGYNPRAVVAFVRTLDSKRIPYGIVQKSGFDELQQTKYDDKCIIKRLDNNLQIDSFCELILEAQKSLSSEKLTIAPSTESLNRFLLSNRDRIEQMNCEIPLVDEETYKKISDKKSFSDECTKDGIIVPNEYLNLENSIIPFVAKPKKYQTDTGDILSPVIINDENDLTNFSETFLPEDFYYQEFIKGQSVYLLYYFYKDGSVDKYSQQNIAQQPDGNSILAAYSSDFHLTDESTKYESLFKKLKFTGLVMVEVKNFNNKHYMIEANPRFWGPSQLFVDAKTNLFESFLHDTGFLKSKPKFANNENVKYFWSGGMVGYDKTKSITYYSDGKQELLNNLEDWAASDVYNRKDTKKLFEYEKGLPS